MGKEKYLLTKEELGVVSPSINSNGLEYNLPFIFEIKDYDFKVLNETLNQIISLHKSFGIRFVLDSEKGILKYYKPFKLELTEIDYPKDLKDLVKPFDLFNDQLARFLILKKDKRKYLFFDFHHAIMDGGSIHLFLRDFFNKYYKGISLNKEIKDIFEITKLEYSERNSENFEYAKKVYEDIFKDLEVDSLPVYDKKDDIKRGANLEIKLDLDMNKVKEFVSKLKIKTSTYFISSFSYLIHLISNNNESLFLNVSNGRNELNKETYGMFVHTFSLYNKFKDDLKVNDFLQNNNELINKLIENDIYSYEDINNDLDIKSEILFAYQGDAFYNYLDLKASEIKTDSYKNSLTFEVFRNESGYYLNINYRSDLFDSDNIKLYAKYYNIILNELLIKGNLDDVSLLNNSMINELNSLNNCDLSYLNLDKTIISEFNEVVKKYKTKDALVFNDKKYTYNELDLLSNRIANELIKRGLKKGDVCPILINRNEFIAIATYAVLKTGAAYMPLDSTYPSDRLEFMIKDSNSNFIILNKCLEDKIPNFKGTKIYLEDLDKFKNEDKIIDKSKPHDLFVLLYTSGTTGLPKGVMIENINVYSFAKTHIKNMGLSKDRKVAAYASFGFDANLMDLHATLLSGASLYIVSEELRLDLINLGKLYDKWEITDAFITTTVGRQFVTEIENNHLINFSTGGEKLVPVDPKNLKYNFYNLYGPTEGVVYCNYHKVDKLDYRVPIGPHTDSFKLYVLDKNLNRLPYLIPGELYISGPQLARGYLNREDANKAFMKNPFESTKPFDRLYKTGDIVRMLPNGEIDFIGRNDGQVKIRGFRIELTEVEQVIREYPLVKEATVKDFSDNLGIKYLVGYIVSDKLVDIDDLKKFILSKKPPYMCPQYIMQIENIPFNQNHKVNKKALPEPKIEKKELVKPKDIFEEKILNIIKSLVGYEISVLDDLDTIGLTSVSTIRLVVMLSKEFNVTIKNKDLEKLHTIRDLSYFIQNANLKDTFEKLDDYPITKTQEGIFVESFSNENSTVYNISELIELDNKLDLNKLKDSIYKVLDKHPYLNSFLFLNDNSDIRIKGFKEKYNIQIIETDKLEKDKLVRPFKLLNSRLFRIEIYKTKNINYLFLDFHHIIFDGESLAIFMKDLSSALKDEKIDDEILSGYEIALIEEKERKSSNFIEAKNYYKNYLSNIEEANSLIKKDVVEEKESQLASIDILNEIENVSKFVSDNKLSPNIFFNLAFAYTLSKFINRDNVYYTTIFNGRNDSRYLNSCTMLVHTIPMFIKFDENSDIVDSLLKLKKDLISLENNSIYSFAEAVKEFNLDSNIMFAYQGDSFEFNKLVDYNIKMTNLLSENVKAIISLDVFKEKDKYRFHLEYDNSYYSEALLNSFIHAYINVLNEFIRCKKFSDIIFLDDINQKKYELFNDTSAPIKYEAFYKYLEDAVNNNSDRLAVIGKDASFTYKEFNEACNKVGHFIVDNGGKIGDRTIMLMPRISLAYVVREGILKSGTAFVPIDPKYPLDRINYIINDSNAKFIITTKDIINNKKDLFKLLKILVFSIEDILKSNKIDNLNLDIKKDDLAYLIYTSGSTGKPKGVMLKEGNLCNYVTKSKSNTSVYEYEKNGKDSVSCSFASFSFDASLQEECVPLSLGHTIYIASEEDIENPLLLSKHLIQYHVDTMFLTPSYVTNILEFDEVLEAFRNFKTLDMGAEAVPVSLAKKLKELGITADLFNGYGPTETTITSTYSRNVLDGTIGKPMVNTKLFIVDKQRRILPIGAVGELVIGGECVGIGYHNLEEKTKENFINISNMRAYCTGDLARYNNDGNIEFFGRLDNQVKLHGLRIELDEIENNILKFNDITRCSVLVINGQKEDYLAAYFTAKTKIEKDELISFISKSLTAYMVPKVFIQLDQMPLTNNGKIDKKKLPLPQLNDEDNKTIEKPINKLEEDLLEIFKKALNLDNVSTNDDFFSLGGTSLSASKVIMLAMNKNIKIDYKDVFEYSTVKTLANFISKDKNIVINEREINTLDSLKNNIIENVDKLETNYKIKSVLLTGSTGFLGIHILKDLVEKGVKVYALVRENKLNKDDRLKALLEYYFDKTYEDKFNKSIFTINCDVTDNDLSEKLKDYQFDAIINCAALVKHFAHDDIIERVNSNGAINMAHVALCKKCRMIQISTLSVAGMSIDDSVDEGIKLHEYELDLGQDISNKYIHSKFMAEKALLSLKDKEGLDLKIIRVGNLMGRNSDGEFQINSITNNFMRNIYSYVYLKVFPISSLDMKVDFTPIDVVSEAIIKLASTNDMFTVFHLANSHTIDMADVIYSLNQYGKKIDIVSDEEFSKKMIEESKNEFGSQIISSLIAYDISDGHTYRFIDTDNTFTTKILYRLGFRWPITDETYLEKMIEAIDTLGFFQRKDL